MIKKAICLLCLVYSIGQVRAQNIYFNNTYDLTGFGANGGLGVIVADSGYYISQFAAGVSGIAFIDTQGNQIWDKSYGVPGSGVSASLGGSFIATSDGGLILGGRIQYPNYDLDAMIWKFNSLGDTIWTKIYIDSVANSRGYSIEETTSDNGFILTGSYNPDVGSAGILLLKTDSLGNLEWQQSYNVGDFGFSVDIGSDGGYLIGGVDLDTIDQQGLVVKTDSVGVFQWSKSSGGPYQEQGIIAEATQDGGYILIHDTVIVQISSSISFNRLRVTKLDNAGNTEWVKTYNTGNNTTSAAMIKEIPGEGFVIVGDMLRASINTITIDGYMFKINLQGDSIWHREFHPCDEGDYSHYFRDVNSTNDGGFVVSGWLNSIPCPQDAWLVKTNCLGFDNPPQPELAYDLTGINEITFTNTSRYSDSLKVTFGDGDTLMTSAPSYFINYDTLGLLIVADTVRYFTHAYADTGAYALTVTGWACGDTGVFTDTVYVAQYVGLEEFAAGNKPKLRSFPNPFSVYTSIEAYVPEGITQAEVIIFNTMGIEIKRLAVNEGYNALTLLQEDLPDAGIYFGALYGYASSAEAWRRQGKLLERTKLVILK